NWQSNRSYAATSTNVDAITDSESESESQSEVETETVAVAEESLRRPSVQRSCEFDSTVEFYVDKSGNSVQRKWDSLPRLSRPQYRIQLRRLTDQRVRAPPHHRASRKSLARSRLAVDDVPQRLTEEESAEIHERTRELRTLVANEPQHLHNWIELHQLLGRSMAKANRLAVAEHQLHTLETALEHHAGNEKLLQLYVATASATYPDSQVATKIEQLLEKQPFEYTLWTALIMTTQGTMARCNVPDVLNIYEQCMRRMHLGPKDQHAHTDDLMLKLFHNCVLFLRQSANCGHMFALLKLALELNAQHLSFDCFEARAADERPLVDYEELVLRSGMPMPEIWTRIERLRQAYNFLPYPQLRGTAEEAASAGLDPQRCIYTDDVCHYIYPLKSKENTLHLLLLTVQLTKLPFVRSDCLAERLCARIDQIGDSEAIEMLLASLGERHSYALPATRAADYTDAMLQLAKELYVSPSFLPHSIGHELYAQCLSSLLLKCSEAFTDAKDELKRRVFVVLWCRFERLRLLLLKLSGKLSEQYVREARQRHRQLLRLDCNRQVTSFYTELAMFEYEAQADGELKTAAFRVLDNILGMHPVDADNVELLHAVVVYAEMLLSCEQRERALHMLSCLALQQPLKSSADRSIAVQPATVLAHSRQQLDAALAAAVQDAAKTAGSAMPLEDYFRPNKLMLLLHAHCLLLCLLGQCTEANELLQHLLRNPLFAHEEADAELTRCRFLREKLRELQLVIMQLPLVWPQHFRVARPAYPLVGMLEQSLLEFPRNLPLLQRWSTLATLPWYKLRGRLVQTKAGILALLHMIIAARCRFVQHSEQSRSAGGDELFVQQLQQQQCHLEHLMRNRVLSMFETFLPNNPNRSEAEAEQYAILRRNSLYWRCYLRSLSHERTSFERSKACLLMALDECPWDKALYMDGATYVPQEVGSLQDVMMEKQIRIYAIPEELNVLREA
ncbi:hypothetical protein KR222_011001, partial [Zaprionus bogoriensis]